VSDLPSQHTVDSAGGTSTGFRLRPRIWVGLVAVAFYVFLAGWVGQYLGELAPEGDSLADFALGHFIPLPIGIGAALLFLHLSRWQRAVWTSPSVIGERRRWWMLAIPVLFLIQIVIGLSTENWQSKLPSTVMIVLAGTLLVGIGEELYLRGILRVSVLERHGEFAALLITSIVFGLAHTVKFLFEGLPVGLVLFQIVFLAMDGALFYGALRATGTLWVPIVLHALNDFQLYLHAGTDGGAPAPEFGNDPITIGSELILMALSVALVISTIRNDLRRRKERRDQAPSI